MQYDELQGAGGVIDNHDHPDHDLPKFMHDKVQLAGDVVPLPINPLQGSDRRSTAAEAADYSVGPKRGSDAKIRSIGTPTVMDWVDRRKELKGMK